MGKICNLLLTLTSLGMLVLSVPAFAGYTANKTSTTAGTDSGGASSSALKLEVTSVSNGSNYVTFRVSKASGGAFTTSGTIYIKKDCGSSSCSTVVSTSISSGSYSKSFSVYMPSYVTAVTGGKNFYGRYLASSNGYWSYAGPINVYCPSLSRPGSTSTTSITTSSARLNWGSVVGANTYRYQVTASSSFSTSTDGKTCYNCVANSTTSSTYRTVSGLSSATTYRWRIRAGNSATAQESSWSYDRTFTTSSPTVTSVSPSTATLNQLTTFTFYGSNLTSGMGFWIDGCDGVTELSGSSTYRQFRCTPKYSTGTKSGIVKTSPSGSTLYNFSITVLTDASVSSVSPSTATLNQLTTFTVYGSNLTSGMGFWIDDCDGVTELSGSSTYRQFRCTPKYTTGTKAGTVKSSPSGTTLHNFSITVVTDVTVSSVSPSTATLDQLTTFTVYGSNLTSGMGFWIDDCDGVTELSGSSTYRQFRCTPKWSLGSQSGNVKDQPGGTTLYNFSVNVTTSLSVSRVDPVRAVANTLTTFTVSGSNLTSGMGFWIDNCATVREVSGGTASERQFTCTPGSSLGNKSGTVKTSSGGATLHNFSIEIVTAPVVNEAKPVRAALNTSTDFVVRGTNLISGMGFWVADCDGVTELSGGTSTERKFRCTPKWSYGSKAGTVKVASEGTVLKSFNVDVVSLPTVTDVQPTQAALNVLTTYTVTGSGLLDGMGFWVEECDVVQELSGGTSTKREFTCTPRWTLGSKQAVVRLASDGTVLKSFNVNVVTLPAVSDVKPVRAAFGVLTTYAVSGSSLPSNMGFWVDQCEGVTELPGGDATERFFECTPSHALGAKAGAVKVGEGGTELATFNVEVITAPSVTSVSPLAATLDVATTFTVAGSNLPDLLAFWIEECSGVRELPGGTSTQRQFECTPSFTTETKQGVVKVAEKGTDLINFEIEVAGPPSVTSVSPTTATINELTTFTVTGSNLTSGLGFWIAECADVAEVAGGTLTSRQFQCTPNYSTGTKSGTVKAADGTLLKSFTVEVGTSSGTVYLHVSDWAQAAADYLVQNGIVEDPPDHDLRGTSEANRAEVATMLYRALGGGMSTADANFASWYGAPLLPLFADVADPDVWYFKPATYLGMLAWASDGDGVTAFNQEPCIFRAAQWISRAWVLKALLESWEQTPLQSWSGVPSFDDVPAGHPAAGYIYLARQLGIAEGTENLYRPDEWTRREDLFVMLHRTLDPSVNPLTPAKPVPAADDFRDLARCSQIGHRYEQPVLSGVQPPTVDVSATTPAPEDVGTLQGVYTSMLQALITDLDPNTYVDGSGVSHQASAFCTWAADGGAFLDLDPGSSEPFCNVKWVAPIDVSQNGGGQTVFTVTLYVGDSLGSEVRREVTLEVLNSSPDATAPLITLDPLPSGLVGGDVMEIGGSVVDNGDAEDPSFGILSVVLSYSFDGGASWLPLGPAELIEGERFRFVWFLPRLDGTVDVKAVATNNRGNRAEASGATTIGQLLTIDGSVVDSYGQPMENALVVLTGGGLNADTLADNLGSFRFTSTADGIALDTSYGLSASLDGRTATADGLVLTNQQPTLYPVLHLDTSPPFTAASPVGGSYPAPQSVELSCNDDRSGCAATYYTVDGTTPTTASPVYGGPVTVGDTTLQFFSVDQAGNVEPVSVETYVIVSLPPSAPTGVSASDGTSTTGVLVTWSAVADARSYEIWRGTSSDSGSAALLGTPAEASYDDTSASVGVTYYYWVKATNSYGTSDFSSSDTGYRDGTPPSAPTGVSATDGTSTTGVLVTWSAVADATSYEVWRGISSDSGSAALLGTPTGASYDDTSASVGVTYYYWIKAANSYGTSDFSSSDTGYRDGTPPSAPTGVSASDGTSTTEVLVTWSPVADATSYEVWRGASSDSGSAALLSTPTGASYDDTSASVGVTYYYWVKATNAYGTSGFSSSDTGYRGSETPTVDVLLVDDDDNSPDVRTYYTAGLDSLGVTYDVRDTQTSDNEPDAATLAAYKAVIWFSGDSYGGTAGPGAAGETALASFLGEGGCLFLSSQDYVYDRGVTPFMTDMLGVASAVSDVTQTTVTGTGSIFSDYGPYALSYPGDNYSDLLSPDSTTTVAFVGDQGDAALLKDEGVYRSLFFGFPFEAVADPNDRRDLLGSILDFCDLIFLDGFESGDVSAWTATTN